MKLFWRRHPPGTAPGTPTAVEPPKKPVRTHLAEYGLETLTEAELATPDGLPEPTPDSE